MEADEKIGSGQKAGSTKPQRLQAPPPPPPPIPSRATASTQIPGSRPPPPPILSGSPSPLPRGIEDARTTTAACAFEDVPSKQEVADAGVTSTTKMNAGGSKTRKKKRRAPTSKQGVAEDDVGGFFVAEDDAECVAPSVVPDDHQMAKAVAVAPAAPSPPPPPPPPPPSGVVAREHTAIVSREDTGSVSYEPPQPAAARASNLSTRSRDSSSNKKHTTFAPIAKPSGASPSRLQVPAAARGRQSLPVHARTRRATRGAGISELDTSDLDSRSAGSGRSPDGSPLFPQLPVSVSASRLQPPLLSRASSNASLKDNFVRRRSVSVAGASIDANSFSPAEALQRTTSLEGPGGIAASPSSNQATRARLRMAAGSPLAPLTLDAVKKHGDLSRAFFGDPLAAAWSPRAGKSLGGRGSGSRGTLAKHAIPKTQREALTRGEELQGRRISSRGRRSGRAAEDYNSYLPMGPGGVLGRLMQVVDKSVKAVPRARKAAALTAEEVEKILLERGRFVLNPEESAFAQLFNYLTRLAMIYVTFLTPFQVVFLQEEPLELFWTDRIVDGTFTIQMILQFFCMYRIKSRDSAQEIWVTSHKSIVWNYLSTWFVIDFLAVFPWWSLAEGGKEAPCFHAQGLDAEYAETICGAQEATSSAALRQIRLLRLLELLRLARVRSLVADVSVWLPFNQAVQTLLKFIVALMVATHWSACLWGFIGFSNVNSFSGTDQLYYSNPNFLKEPAAWLIAGFDVPEGMYKASDAHPAHRELEVENNGDRDAHDWRDGALLRELFAPAIPSGAATVTSATNDENETDDESLFFREEEEAVKSVSGRVARRTDSVTVEDAGAAPRAESVVDVDDWHEIQGRADTVMLHQPFQAEATATAAQIKAPWQRQPLRDLLAQEQLSTSNVLQLHGQFKDNVPSDAVFRHDPSERSRFPASSPRTTASPPPPNPRRRLGLKLDESSLNWSSVPHRVYVKKLSWIERFCGCPTARTLYDVNQCLQCRTNAAQLYSVALYYALMTLTSIGYGDTGTATTPDERFFGCMIMVLAGVLWTSVIGSACGVLANMDPQAREFYETIDNLNDMMGELGLSKRISRKLRIFFYNTRQLSRLSKYRELMDQLSPSLQAELFYKLNSVFLMQVPYFRDVERKVLANVCQKMRDRVLAQGEVFVDIQNLYILKRGLILIDGRVFTSGTYWGEDVILDDADLLRFYRGAALTYAECAQLLKQDLAECLRRFQPADRLKFRRHTVRLAAMRGVINEARRISQAEKNARAGPVAGIPNLPAGREGGGVVGGGREHALALKPVGSGWTAGPVDPGRRSSTRSPGTLPSPQPQTPGARTESELDRVVQKHLPFRRPPSWSRFDDVEEEEANLEGKKAFVHYLLNKKEEQDNQTCTRSVVQMVLEEWREGFLRQLRMQIKQLGESFAKRRLPIGAGTGAGAGEEGRLLSAEAGEAEGIAGRLEREVLKVLRLQQRAGTHTLLAGFGSPDGGGSSAGPVGGGVAGAAIGDPIPSGAPEESKSHENHGGNAEQDTQETQKAGSGTTYNRGATLSILDDVKDQVGRQRDETQQAYHVSRNISVGQRRHG